MNGTVWTVFLTNCGPQAMTDVDRRMVFIDPESPDFEEKLRHELAHCAICSYGVSKQLDSMAKRGRRASLEELICNVLAVHGPWIEEIVEYVSLKGGISPNHEH